MLYNTGIHLYSIKKKLIQFVHVLPQKSNTGNAEGKLTKAKACMQRMASIYGTDKK